MSDGAFFYQRLWDTMRETLATTYEHLQAAVDTADDEPGADVCARDEFWRGYEDWRLKDDADGMDN